MSSDRVVDASRAQVVRLRSVGDALPFRDAEEVAGESRKSLPEIEREAFEKGFQAGERSGHQMAERKLEAALKRLGQSLKELAELRRQLVTSCEQDVVRLAVEIARKLVQREIQLDDKVILTLVRVALEKAASGGRIIVCLHPQDYEIVEKHYPSLFSQEQDREVVLRKNEQLKRGDCLIESDYGTVDGRLSEQFKEVENGLLSQF